MTAGQIAQHFKISRETAGKHKTVVLGPPVPWRTTRTTKPSATDNGDNLGSPGFLAKTLESAKAGSLAAHSYLREIGLLRWWTKDDGEIVKAEEGGHGRHRGDCQQDHVVLV